MTNSPDNKSNNRVSALDTVLKLLLSLWNKIKYYVGLIIIDNLMRNIVLWYDKRHPKPTPTRKHQENEEILKLHSMIDAKETECLGLRSQLNKSQQECASLNQEISQLKVSLTQYRESSESLRYSLNELKSKVGVLQHESENLRKRCLPETDIPSMIYYAQGDASGLWLRKISPIKTTEHLYQLNTKQGDTSICIFTPIIQTDLKDIIANRNITLLACEIISISPSASSIEIVECGEAMLDNNRWKVIHKAKIKLI